MELSSNKILRIYIHNYPLLGCSLEVIQINTASLNSQYDPGIANLYLPEFGTVGTHWHTQLCS